MIVGGYATAQSAEARQATLATHIPAMVAAGTAAYAGAPAQDSVMHLVVSLPQRNTVELHAAMDDIYNRYSPNYHHYLSVAEFTKRFGPTEADYDAAVKFFAAQGMTVTARSENRYIIDVDARVADIERVFHVTMGLYRHPIEDRTFISPDRAPTLDLVVPVQEIIGLNDLIRPYSKFVHDAARATRNAGGTGPGGQFDGKDIRKLYAPMLPSLTGAGQSVGLMELSGYNISDVTLFFNAGYGANRRVRVLGINTDGAVMGCSPADCDDSEQALDIEYTISMASDLASLRVYVGNSPEDVLNRMATDNISKVLSTSWGWNENFATDDGLFVEFAMQGQTNLTASGDYSSLTASGPWPEEDANIVAVGGTDVATRHAGSFWASETGWSGSAGGPSTDPTILIPTYQSPFIRPLNGGSKTVRNVPDVAANADTDMEICANGGCFGGNGGTSFASPIWAGVIALVNQQAASLGKQPVGFINPAIYTIGAAANYRTIFHDIVAGNNTIYNCVDRYDLVTGLGTPQVGALVTALTQ
jgi:xanthomonalisin